MSEKYIFFPVIRILTRKNLAYCCYTQYRLQAGCTVLWLHLLCPTFCCFFFHFVNVQCVFIIIIIIIIYLCYKQTGKIVNFKKKTTKKSIASSSSSNLIEGITQKKNSKNPNHCHTNTRSIPPVESVCIESLKLIEPPGKTFSIQFNLCLSICQYSKNNHIIWENGNQNFCLIENKPPEKSI